MTTNASETPNAETTIEVVDKNIPNFKIDCVIPESKSDDDDMYDDPSIYVDDAERVLTAFFENYPETKFIDANLISSYFMYDWTVELTMHFSVLFEGDNTETIVEARWYEHGGSCDGNSYEQFHDILEYNPSCLPQMNKWYRLEKNQTSLDIAVKTNNATLVRFILDEKYATDIAVRDRTITYYKNQTELLNHTLKSNESYCTIL